MPLAPYPDDLNINAQSVELPQSKQDGFSGVWTSGTWSSARLIAPEEPRTLFELFEQSVARHPNQAMFLRRPIVTQDGDDKPTFGTTLVPTSYQVIQQRRTNLGSALLALERAGRLGSQSVHASPPEITHPHVPHFGRSNRVKNGARRGWGVGLWSQNREEWQVVDLAAHAYGLVTASLYETLGPDVARYIINHCPLSIVFAASNHLTDLLKLAPVCPTLRVIVSMDPLPKPERDVLTAWATSVNVELLFMDELEAWGTEDGIKCDPGPVRGVAGEEELDRDRILTISYTSGTTGDPKGVVLTNKNLTTAIVSNALGSSFDAQTEEWRFLSYLPLSHIYERFLQLLVMYGDGTIALTTGDTTRLLEDAQIIKPHLMAGVPRVYNRIHAAVKAQMNAGGLKGALLNRAVNTKLAKWRETGEVKHTLYDALVFRKIRNLLGGQIRYISSGAAPLAPDVHEMLKVCFSCDVVQGYGMTETIGTCTKGIPWDVRAVGTCGQIQPCNQIKLADVSEMGYTSNDLPNPRGEVLLKGYNIFPGYLHDPENTAKTIDSDGWMHTGDIGEIDREGRLKIVDRIKNVVKLSQGEYVALEKLEGMYALDPIFATLLVHGDSTRSHLVGLGVLDPEQAASLATSVLGKNFTPNDFAALEEAIKDKRMHKAVINRLGKIAKKHGLNGFEMIKGVHLTLSPFPDDILTPTFKVKRNVAAKKFKEEIDASYERSEAEQDTAKAAKL
ncbi:hypothetical protein BCR39DRAFT_524520 [Naematelia encephala]|uniref:AMP-dependent synthetase/ligase domain-containing protein n=1 Tax=Naematelia encephala TaxID=71784 RepID=A0A1Y2BBI1_9TREE|nr:hypothetical protein BCR39DRAFT_524520 [Naematelia encephala]